ncbi:MAG: hypothetical protein ACOCQ3_05340 [Natronomonas sp.]
MKVQDVGLKYHRKILKGILRCDPEIPALRKIEQPSLNPALHPDACPQNYIPDNVPQGLGEENV